ncbi:hypothetical protein [Spirosoma sp.]|uniref:hypothetical protein n=1 Tax=Spirosoma sp. TaxID=1899569 RepID=UPI003B3B372D
MQYYLRFLCYDDQSRQSSAQIHSDIPIDGLMHFDYGDIVKIGDDADDPSTWLQYYVANLTLSEQINDPARPGTKALLLHVYLARAEQWTEFEIPTQVRKIWEDSQL